MKYVTAGKGEKVVRQDYEKVIQFTVDDFLQPGHLLQEVTIPPKTKQRVHFHTQQTEVFYILEGEAEMTFNGEMVAAKKGDAFICEPHDKHNLWNKSNKPFKVLVFKIDYQGDDDTHWEEN